MGFSWRRGAAGGSYEGLAFSGFEGPPYRETVQIGLTLTLAKHALMPTGE